MFLFYSKKTELHHKNYDIIIEIHKNIKHKKLLFAIFAEKLHFPHYFGSNWDAFYDCLCNLEYSNPTKILILHEDLPFKNSATDRSAYVNILVDMESNIAKDDCYKIDIALPSRYRKLCVS